MTGAGGKSVCAAELFGRAGTERCEGLNSCGRFRHASSRQCDRGHQALLSARPARTGDA